MSRTTKLFALLCVSLPLAACGGKGDAATPQATSQATSQAAATVARSAVPAAVDATIRKVLAERIPKLPKIDEVTPSQIPGLFEVRFGGTEIIYTDAGAQFVVQGALIETKTLANLTEQRIDKLTAVNFAELPLKDALVFKQGDGSRKIAVFADPNCGYCKRFERDLLGLQNVTVYTFLMPILGPDSTVKSRDIWCAKDAAVAWRAWMIEGVVAGKASESCKAEALARNVDLGRKHRVNGTPALFFEDGTRKAGALPAKQVDELLTTASAKKS